MYLDNIVAYKREEIKAIEPIGQTRNKKIINVAECLKKSPIITEIKKASPSMGDINMHIDICEQAQKYKKGGAGAISVLTDKNFFKGDITYLSDVSNVVDLPLLCKDFIIDEYDIIKPEKQRELWRKVIARIRGCKDGTGAVSTTPEGFRETYELFEKKKIGKLIRAKTTDIMKDSMTRFHNSWGRMSTYRYVTQSKGG